MATVLVADDEYDLCTVLSRMVRLFGYSVECVDCGELALEAVRRDRPDLVILDLMMPDMTGFDVLRQLRADPALDGVAVVMYTALSDPRTRQTAAELGAAEFLVKSHVGFEEMRRVVDRYAAASRGGHGGAEVDPASPAP